MDLLKQIGVDNNAENNGKWFPLFGGQIEVKVARFYNKNYTAAWRTIVAVEQIEKQVRDDTISPEKLEQITVDIIAKTVLLDWKNIEENGEVLPYSYENAKRLLTDPRLRLFRQAVVDLANSINNYKLELVAENKDLLKKN